MNKNQFIRKLAQKGYTIKAAEIIVDDILDTITEALLDNESVQFYGFGEFKVTERKSRDIKCVGTGELINIPAIKTPKFEPGKTFKRAIRDGVIRK